MSQRTETSDGTQQAIDIVIPVYNEGENILRVLNAFGREIHVPIRVMLCYDRDDDTTLAALRGFTASFPIVFVKNEGHGAHGAVLTGLRCSDAPAAISYMADDDYNAGIVDQMVASFRQGNDIVCASRFIPGGSMIGCRWQKAYLVRAVAWTLYHIGRLPVHDPTNAFRLISRRLRDAVTIESTEGFTYSIELLVKCYRMGWGISEVPAKWFERSKGASRFRILKWAPGYLRWYFHAFATTYLRRKEI